MIRRTVILLVAASSLVGAQEPRRRAILASFDGLSEGPARLFTDSATTPVLWSFFHNASCAEGSRPPFVSVTPSGHAAIFTGAYSNVNGVAAIANGALPLPATTILETTDGYRSPALTAEPIWLAAARQGKRTFSHMATQSPAPPGYPASDSSSTELDRTRASAAATNQRRELAAVNIYNEKVADARVITESSIAPRPAGSWSNLTRLGVRGGAVTREISWPFGDRGDSLHALFVHSSDGRAGVVVATARDASRGVFARLASTDTSRSAGRALARHFSAGLPIQLGSGKQTFVFARLFELAPDLSRFTLFVSEARVTQGNRPDVASAFDARVRGVPGNGAERLLERGAFGPTIVNGGDGIAERRYLETAELVTRQFMAGTDAGWSRYAPDLLVDYLPYPDEALHAWYGLASSTTPDVPADVRVEAARLLNRAFQLVDRRLLALQRLAEASPGTALFIAGEHGMRPSWKTFRPNVVLRAAGLLSVDADGAIDLSKTQAAATRGGWISVNRESRKGGIVDDASVEAVLTRVERALRDARDSTGAPIVTQTWRANGLGADSLGLGGPAAGDLYYAVAPGFYPNAGVQGSVTSRMPVPRGEHGFAGIEGDMWAAFCVSPSVGLPRNLGPVRAIDVAPTVSAWLGIAPPADAKGRSLIRPGR